MREANEDLVGQESGREAGGEAAAAGLAVQRLWCNECIGRIGWMGPGSRLRDK